MKTKKAISAVITSVLLILLVVTIGSIIYLSSNKLVDEVQEGSATALAKEECPKTYKFNLAGCFNNDAIMLDIVNLNEEIPYGSLLSIESDTTTVLKPIPYGINITQGGGASIIVPYINNIGTNDILRTLKCAVS